MLAADRLLLQSVTEGSTVFLFQIVDDPDDRAQDVAIRMEQMILKNEWNMDQFTLLQMKWEDSPLGTIDTKEDEPHVSTGSTDLGRDLEIQTARLFCMNTLTGGQGDVPVTVV